MAGSPFGIFLLTKILAPLSQAIVALIAFQSLQYVLLILWSYVPVIMVVQEIPPRPSGFKQHQITYYLL